MIEPTITADDLVLYALDLLEGDERAPVETMLRKSTAAREELSRIRGDLALFALAAEQHTPPALTRQRLLKQVARERRTVPVDLPLEPDRDVPAGHESREDRGPAEREGRGGPRTGSLRNEDRGLRGRETGERRSGARDGETARGTTPLGGGSLGSGSRSDGSPGGGLPGSRTTRISGESAARVLRPMPTEPPAHPVLGPTSGGTSGQIRTAAGRSEGRPAAASGLAVPRLPQGTREIDPEPAAAGFTADAVGFSADSATFSAERTTFSPDPKVFPREARAMETSAPAHSVTMFEQHFAAEAAAEVSGPELPPDPEAYSGRRREEDVVSSVQDSFVPSSAKREESFGFSSYRDYGEAGTEPDGVGRWLGWAGWVVAAVIAVAAAVALRDEFRLRDELSQQQSALLATQTGAGRAEAVLDAVQNASSQHFLVTRTDAAPAPSGRVAYLPERGALLFQGSNLETLQPYKTYELWLIPAGEGRPPVPAGLFKPDGHGFAAVVLPQLPQGVIAANFGVTIEDEGGSATPTLPIILVGQGA